MDGLLFVSRKKNRIHYDLSLDAQFLWLVSVFGLFQFSVITDRGEMSRFVNSEPYI